MRDVDNSTEPTKDLIKKYLVKDEEDIKDVIKELQEYIYITSNGNIRFTDKGKKLDKIYKIALYMAAKDLAYKAEIVNNNTTTLEEVSEQLKIDKKIVSARVSDLIDKSIVERVGEATYKIASYNTLLEKLRKNKSGELS
jgi:predicted transcriptional regulator